MLAPKRTSQKVVQFILLSTVILLTNLKTSVVSIRTLSSVSVIASVERGINCDDEEAINYNKNAESDEDCVYSNSEEYREPFVYKYYESDLDKKSEQYINPDIRNSWRENRKTKMDIGIPVVTESDHSGIKATGPLDAMGAPHGM